MASTYSNLKFQLMATGENTGTWGNVTNTNLGTAVEQAITGSADVAFSSADVTLTLLDDNATQVARNLRLNLTGTSGGARSLIVPAIQKVYIVNNGLADAVTVKNATGTGIAVPAGKTMWVYNDGTNVLDAVNAVTSLAVAGAATLGTPLAISSGGTGVGTLTGYVYGNGTSAFTASTTIPGSVISGTVTASLIGNVTGDLTGNVTGSAASASTLTPGNDLTVYRSGSPTTGYVFLGNSGTHYVGYDGTNFLFSGSGYLYGPANGFAGNLTGNVTGSATYASAAASANALNVSNSYTVSALTVDSNAGGSGGQLTLTNTGYGSKYFRVSSASTLEIVNNAYSAVIYQFDDSGNFTASGAVTAYSDARLKKDLVPISGALDKIEQLAGYTYTRIDSGQRQTGLIAQDVQKVLPEAVMEGEYMSIAYGNLMGLIVEGIKELRDEFDAYKAAHP